MSIFLSTLLLAASLSANEPADTIKKNTVALQEVVVTGARTQTDARYLPMTVNVIGKQELEEKHHTSILPTVAEQVPGVFVTSRGLLGYGLSGGGSGGINVRGLGGGEGRMMVLIDGHPQYSGIYGHNISDSYQTMMAERVEVLRGPASAIYGSNAMGGVINIVTHGQRQDGVSTDINLGAGSYGTILSQIGNTVRHKGFTSNAAAQYNRSDNHRPDMGFEQYGGHLNLAYELNANWKVFADGDVTHFNASHPGAIGQPLLEADQWITRGVVNTGVENRFKRSAGAFTFYSNFGRHKLNDGYGPAYHKNTPQTELFRSKDALTGISLYQSLNLFTGNRITVGADYQHIYGHAYYTDRQTGEVVTDKGASGDNRGIQSGKKHMNEVAGYANFHQDLLHWLTLDAGIRYDHHSVAGGEWVPQGGLVVRPSATSELKALIGKGYRNPTLKEMYLYGSANDALSPERITNYELSWRHRMANGAAQYGVNLFYLNGDNLIQTINRKNVNTGEIENWGAEAELSWRISKRWQLNSNHSWLRMVHPLVAAPRYKGFLGARFTEGRWSVNAGVQRIDGLYTEVSGKETTECFTLLNATVNYHAAKNIHLWLCGDNLLAQSYEINAGYPMPRATIMGGIRLTLKR